MIRIKLILIQRDFFLRRRRVFNNVPLVIRNKINYLPLNSVLEILEYDFVRRNQRNFIVTDGSEFVRLQRKGSIAKKEEISLRIDPMINVNNMQFISLRSVNRLFNVDLIPNIQRKRVCVRQPGRFIVTFKGDTLRSLARQFNTSIRRLLAVNKNLKDPIPPNIKVRIPTIDVDTANVNEEKQKSVRTNFHLEAEPVIALARTLRGTPYKFGAGPFARTGRFDCSSFVQYIFGKNGERLPRTSRVQSRRGRTLAIKDIGKGDLLFFRRPRYSDNRIGHVGMGIGNGLMIHTYRTRPGVTISRWRDPRWFRRFVFAKEIL